MSRPASARAAAQPLRAGVDEAGRGSLAGPLCAAAVILHPAREIAGLADSKTLSAARRESLAADIRAHALAWAVAYATLEEIERLNVLQASLLAMSRALGKLRTAPAEVLVDGNHCPRLEADRDCRIRAVVGGDRCVPAISAASILAKVERDAQMRRLDVRYPGYGFARHKGYPTAAHLQELRRRGVSPIHRRSYAPVRRLLARGMISVA